MRQVPCKVMEVHSQEGITSAMNHLTELDEKEIKVLKHKDRAYSSGLLDGIQGDILVCS